LATEFGEELLFWYGADLGCFGMVSEGRCSGRGEEARELMVVLRRWADMVCSCKGEKVVLVVVDWWGRRQGVAGKSFGWFCKFNKVKR
jgi:hypothetical protein